MKRIVMAALCLVLSSAIITGPGAAPASAASWGTCGLVDSPAKKLRTFDRAAGAGFAAGKAVLTCGKQNWNGNSGWGFRHVRYRHQADWAKIGLAVGGTWQSVADWSTAQTLTAPAYVMYSKKNDTYLYKAQLRVYDQQRCSRYSFYAYIVVARKTQNIITAYPSIK